MRPLTWGKRYLFGDEFDFLLLSFTNQKTLKLLKIFWPRFLLGLSAIRLVGECHSVNTEKNYLKGKKKSKIHCICNNEDNFNFLWRIAIDWDFELRLQKQMVDPFEYFPFYVSISSCFKWTFCSTVGVFYMVIQVRLHNVLVFLSIPAFVHLSEVWFQLSFISSTPKQRTSPPLKFGFNYDEKPRGFS